jgi:hypothetical protein
MTEVEPMSTLESRTYVGSIWINASDGVQLGP